jgi:hypothetical protein
MTLFQNSILFTNHHGNLQEMLEIVSFLRYVDLYLTSEWAGFTWDILYIISGLYVFLYLMTSERI